MSNKNSSIRLIYRALDQVNEQLPSDSQLKKSPETVIFGKDGVLDSLGLVSLLAATEQTIEDELDISLTLADERAMSQKRSPFKTIQTLSQYIDLLLSEK